MPYKTRRQARYNKLRDCGFVPFEARALSRISFKVPYMLPLMKQRFTEYIKAIKWAKKRDIPEPDFNKRWLNFIKRRYVMKGWKHKSEPWGVTAGFRMLKDKEREYKAKWPQYESPWEKRQKDFRDFVRKLEITYEKYPKGYGKRAPKLRYLPEGGAEIIER